MHAADLGMPEQRFAEWSTRKRDPQTIAVPAELLDTL
jgi:hypothetical protein